MHELQSLSPSSTCSLSSPTQGLDALILKDGSYSFTAILDLNNLEKGAPSSDPQGKTLVDVESERLCSISQGKQAHPAPTRLCL